MSDRKLDHLFRRFQSRDDLSALAEVFDMAAPELLRVARYLARDAAAAEDCVQQTFLAAIEGRDRFDRSARVMPWLLGILANQARKPHARAAREPDPERLRQVEPEDPAEVAAERELRDLVDESVSGLPEKYAPVLRAYLEYGKSPSEIARSLGITANAASVRIHRGLDLLRRALPKGAAIGTAAGAASAQGAGSGLASVREAVLAHAEASVPQAAAAGAAGAGLGSSLLGGYSAAKLALVLGSLAATAGVTFVATQRAYESRVESLNAELDSLRGELRTARAEVPVRSKEEVLPTREVPTVRRESRPTPANALVPETPTADEWLLRFVEAPTWRDALSVAYELARLDHEESLRIMQGIFARIPSSEYRRQILKPFVFNGGLPSAVEILHLAAIDLEPEVRRTGHEYLQCYSFENFADNPGGYEPWRARFGGKPVPEILRANVGEFVNRLALMSEQELLDTLKDRDLIEWETGRSSGVDLRELFREAGFPDVIARLIHPDGSEEVVASALRRMVQYGADEGWLRANLLPVVENHELYTSSVVDSAFDALGQEGNVWAIEPITDAMLSIRITEGLPYSSAARALARIGDRRVIPTLIGMIVASDEYATNYGVGYFGLSKLTGVDYDESHGAKFWLEWWEKNRSSMPPHVQGMDIPRITLPR